jgi:hypothetical protein
MEIGNCRGTVLKSEALRGDIMQRGIFLFTIIASFCFAAPLLQANEDEVCDD